MNRRRIAVAAGLVLAALVLVAAAVRWSGWRANLSIDHTDARRVSRGAPIYARHCASCHGRNLEGQPDWQSRNAQGRLPAPPHDEHGHTWHHEDSVLFDVTRHGLANVAPPGYVSDMPAFKGILSDEEIIDVLAFIKSRWPALIHDKRREAGMN